MHGAGAVGSIAAKCPAQQRCTAFATRAEAPVIEGLACKLLSRADLSYHREQERALTDGQMTAGCQSTLWHGSLSEVACVCMSPVLDSPVPAVTQHSPFPHPPDRAPDRPLIMVHTSTLCMPQNLDFGGPSHVGRRLAHTRQTLMHLKGSFNTSNHPQTGFTASVTSEHSVRYRVPLTGLASDPKVDYRQLLVDAKTARLYSWGDNALKLAGTSAPCFLYPQVCEAQLPRWTQKLSETSQS